MTGNKFDHLEKLKQSIWYDNIQRSLLESGYLKDLIKHNIIRGITSNPSIFNNAIANSTDYDSALMPMALAGWKPEDIFYQLAIEDIQQAADLFLPLYKRSEKLDGYVSLEVNPKSAHDTEMTISEAIELWKRVARPNLMIKIPATLEGLPAITEAIAAGINVNVTLIFSIERYALVIDAYLKGLEKRLAAGEKIDSIASVASFFVSRMDAKIEKKLTLMQEKNENQNLTDFFGKPAIANTRLAYKLFQDKFSEERFIQLIKQGARIQRPLWASTGTKNPSYRDVLYIEELIAPDTVNTVPPKTLDAFIDHGEAALTLEGKVESSKKVLENLEDIGISVKEITDELEAEGVISFIKAFEDLMTTIDQRSQSIRSNLGSLIDPVNSRIAQLDKNNFSERMYALDASLWTQDPAGQAEIRNRLGWLRAPQNSRKLLPELNSLLAECQVVGYTHILLLGMGGSSLAPEVISMTFGVRESNGKLGLQLSILDSTDPMQVKAAEAISPMEKTLYIVSSKSGTTSETKAFLSYFWDKAVQEFGKKAGDHFIAITDAGSFLDEFSTSNKFRRTFNADSSVGGRYAALIEFGVVPAALMGLDMKRFLGRASWMADQCDPLLSSGRNPGLVLGAVIGEAALQGKDKLTILTDPEFAAFGSWLEQLVAESTGKEGKGIIPIDIEPLIPVDSYSNDRIFVYLNTSGTKEDFVKSLKTAGHPIINFNLNHEYDIAAHFYIWEFATAVASSILEVNSFDQPDVQDNKNRTKQKIEDYINSGKFPEKTAQWSNLQVNIFSDNLTSPEQTTSLLDILDQFLNLKRKGDYIAINAYFPRNENNFVALQNFREYILNTTGCATTLGFGPRFLHSTGQLHKGGPDNTLIIQLTQDPPEDFDIPGEAFSFSALLQAQAIGDLEALQARNRRVIRIHLKDADINNLYN
ncbi:MAG: bifunctional transaldolase/phosoglucose isomerase [Anaerolineaceae bacterium]|nr:bifunctional transaldolase/phosoglucose isomerase [Anaerolineaceae bacterium]